MRYFTAFLAGGAIGWLIGSTIEFYRNFDKNYDFNLGEVDD